MSEAVSVAPAVSSTIADPLRVALVAPYDLSQPGGVNGQIRYQAEALRALGHQVVVYGPASGGVFPGEVRVGGTYQLSMSGTVSGMGFDPRAIRQASRILRMERFDVIHVHEPLTPLVPWLFLEPGRAVTVGTFHVHREGGHRIYRATSWMLRPLARRLDARIAVSDAAMRTVSRYFPGTYHIIPNGVRLSRFDHSPPVPAALDPCRRHVLFIGRPEGRKGLDHLLRAMARLRCRVPSVRLLVAGDGPLRSKYEQLARGLGDAAIFLGQVSDDDLVAYLKASEVVCAPSVGGESFGVTLLEGLAAGKPVVASRIGGYEEFLGPTGAGVLVPPADPEALADGLASILLDDALRDRLAALARSSAAAYDWSHLATQLVDLYRSLLEFRRERDRTTPATA